ncbi:hypothetical protein [Halorubrum halophilum]|uniref:hypothetical protein n=1 Tax=Halorubrum halophilum TaxID=413816 RepID=UPI001F3A30D5|nr:hypothetical protein [Halorubrum halophilum]
MSDIESLPLDVTHDAVNGELLCGDEGTFERFNRDTKAKFDEQRETLRHRQRGVTDWITVFGFRS